MNMSKKIFVLLLIIALETVYIAYVSFSGVAQSETATIEQGLSDLSSMDPHNIGLESVGNNIFLLTDPFLNERLRLAIKAENEEQARSVLPFLYSLSSFFQETEVPFAHGFAIGDSKARRKNKPQYNIYFDAQKYKEHEANL